MVTNRERVIKQEQDLQHYAANNRGNFLHLGCGPKILPGFTNVDKYHQHPDVLNYDIYMLPEADKRVDMIYCSHVLEHLPIRHAQRAIREWSRVLKGTLYLAIPDIEHIMRELLAPNILPEHRWWYMFCLFGYQTNGDNQDPNKLDYPVDPGQFHTCGFTKETIRDDLEKNGFKIIQLYNYDGWSTPSIWIEAVIS